MIADQITQATAAPRTARTATASMAQFLDEYPQFDAEPLSWSTRGGVVYVDAHYLSPESSRLVSELAQALHTTARESRVVKPEGPDTRCFSCEAVFDGTRWSVAGFMPVAAEDGATEPAVAA